MTNLIPYYYTIQFTKEGNIYQQQEVDQLMAALGEGNAPPDDLIIMAHGWNNDMDDARRKYDAFFKLCADLQSQNQPSNVMGRRIMGLGVLWPSKRFTDQELIPGGGAAGFGTVQTRAKLEEMLEEMKTTLDPEEKDQSVKDDIEHAKNLIKDLEDKKASQDEFVDRIRQHLCPGQDLGIEDPEVLFKDAGNQILATLKDSLARPQDTGNTAGGAATVPAGGGLPDGIGGAQGLGDLGQSIMDGARRFLNMTTYYTMKERAGIVGQNGLCPLLERIRSRFPNIHTHLVGHSFGGRLVTAAANALRRGSIAESMTLLQAAFSHNGFAEKFDGNHNGSFREVVTEKKIQGPILVTYTENDKAVGIAYAIASRLAQQAASRLGDANDRYGGIGRNGALVRFTREAINTTLEATGTVYQLDLDKHRIFNLEASDYVKDHGDILKPEIAYAVLCGVMQMSHVVA